MEKRYIHQQGQMVWVLLNASLVRDEQGNPLHFISQIQDITARKAAQKVLELQSVIMDNMAGGVCLVKASDHTIVYTNPKFEAMFDYIADELRNQSVSLLNYEEEQSTAEQKALDITTQIDRDGEAKYEVHNVRKDGTPFWCRANTSKFEHPDYGTVYVAVQEDITELKRTEAALQKSEERLQLALEASGDGLWDWEIGMEGYLSPRYQEMLGYEPGELVINLQMWKDMIHPDDRTWVLDRLNAHLRDSSVLYVYDYRLRTKSGEWKWLTNYGKVMAHDAQGNPLRMIGTHRDISERKQTEVALRESAAREQAIAEVIQQMRQTLNLETIFATTTQELRRVLSCDRVLVYRFNPDWSGAVVAESVGSGWISVIETLTNPDATFGSRWITIAASLNNGTARKQNCKILM